MLRKLRKAIIDRFETQAQFCFLMNLSEPFVSRVINRRYQLTSAEKRRWCKALGVEDPKELFGEE